VADSLEKLADELDKLEPCDFAGLTKILSGIVKENKQSFRGQQLRRGVVRRSRKARLPITGAPSTPCGPRDPEGQEGLLALRVLSERELAARVEIIWSATQGLEHRSQLRPDIAKTMILPQAWRTSASCRRRQSKGVAQVTSTSWP